LIKLLAIIEANSVTGPAKNLLAFCESARNHLADLPPITTTIATFLRPPADQSQNEFITAARERGIAVEVIEERFRFDTRVIARLSKVIDSLQPDIIQSHNVKSHFLVKASGRWRHTPWVAFHHGYTTTDFKMRAYNQLDRWSLPDARRVVTMNQDFAKQLAGLGARPENLRILHNAVDAQHISDTDREAVRQLKTQLGIADNQQLVIAIGRLSKEKGHRDLLLAYARLLRANATHRSRLVLVGDGPERENLEQVAMALGIADRVIFSGQVSDVRPFYAMADLMVLPSLSEGSPNVLLEAMAARVPVVSTRVGGVPEIATHQETAWLVNPHDPQALAEAMALLLREANLAQGLAAQAQAHVLNHHSPASRLRALVEMYSELVPEKTLAYTHAG
jgi:glycosyltransferase involved in cell wall biosynthesis